MIEVFDDCFAELVAQDASIEVLAAARTVCSSL